MDNTPKVPLTFDVNLYGNLEQYDESKSKCRVRIFYKGLNRNRTYISDDFANQLIASLPYAPIKGIFDSDDVDYKSHGEKNNEGRIYGVVMADPEFAWEDHEDSDGVVRTYACASVLLYTSLYNEAKLIPDSSQSMEINPYTYSGEWRIWDADGQPYYYFKEGSLFGLQVLGAATEPCFEGAAFYNLLFEKIKKEYQPLMDYIKNSGKKEEKIEMDKILFRLSDNEKANKIWDAMNPNYNEQGGWQVDYYILDVYDDYALCVNEEGYLRAYYTKNEDDTVTINKTEKCVVTDVSETEFMALEAMKTAAGSYEAFKNNSEADVEKIAELESQLENLGAATNSDSNDAGDTDAKADGAAEYEEKIANLQSQLDEANNTITEKETELEEAKANYAALESEKIGLENTVNDLTNEKEELVSFKHSIETKQKEDILVKYAEHISDEASDNLKSMMDNYSVEDFRKEVCAVVLENDDPTIFSKNVEPDRYYKGGTPDVDSTKGVEGWERILIKHKHGGNK